jgi:hypothetical protein
MDLQIEADEAVIDITPVLFGWLGDDVSTKGHSHKKRRAKNWCAQKLQKGRNTTFFSRCSMKYPLRPLLVVLAPLALTFCGDKNTNAVGLVVGPGVNGAVSMLDQCDSASFNAAVGVDA